MNRLDDEMRQASGELRGQLGELPVEPFVPRRRRAPIVVAGLASLVALALVSWWLLPALEDRSVEVDVFTRPEPASTPDPGTEAGRQTTPESAENIAPVPTAVTEPSASAGAVPEAAAVTEPSATAVPEAGVVTEPSAGPDGVPSATATARPEPTAGLVPPPVEPPVPGQLTRAEPGEYVLPMPGDAAWNVDATAVLLYRTGSADPRHDVFDPATGDIVATVDLSPPDIEQIYWHPTDPNTLVTFEGADVVAFDTESALRRVLHSFSGCSRVHSGYPSPPAADGTLVGLCETGASRDVVSYNLATGVEARAQGSDEIDSVHVSPSGRVILARLGSGMAKVLDAGLRDRGIELETGSDVADFVTMPDGAEFLAGVRFEGPAIGSVVLTPLDGGPAEVVVGPETGHEYPPGGVNIATAGTRIVFSTRGPASGSLGGRLVYVNLSRVGDEIVATAEHGSGDGHGYWSGAFVSISPDGRFVVHSSDSGTDRVDTWVTEFPT